MSRPRSLCLAEPERAPKKFCVRGHRIAKVGYSLHRYWINGIAFTSRRCLACLRDDVTRCKAKKKAA
jgi:hypothetical protein